jgi:guanylate kinase
MSNNIIIVGAAASGKDWFRKKLEEKGFIFGPPTTSRPSRDKEVHGKDYFFITKETFLSDQFENKFVEYSYFDQVDWYYGTHMTTWNTSNVFVMNPQSLKQLDSIRRKDSLVIYLDIPVDIRISRLYKRADSNDKSIRRVISDEIDFHNFSDWDIKLNSVDDFNFNSNIIKKELNTETLYNDIYQRFNKLNFT